MTRVPHRIRRQSWLIRTGSVADAFLLRARMREAWEDVLLPALERAFDEASDPDHVIRLPRLELRVRVASPDAVTKELPHLIEAAIAEQLRKTPGVWTALPQAIESAQDTRLAIVHYLRTGSLLWDMAGRPVREIMEELRAAVAVDAPHLLEALGDVSQPEAYCFRLLQLLDEPATTKLLTSLPGDVSQIWKRVLGVVLGVGGEALIRMPGRHAQLELAASLLSRALTQPTDDVATAIIDAAAKISDAGTVTAVERFLLALPETPAEWKRAVLRETTATPGRRRRQSSRVPRERSDNATTIEDETSPETAAKEKPLPRRRNARRTAASTGGSDALSPHRASKPAEDRLDDALTAADLAARVAMTDDALDTGFGVSVHHAGLILLNPFIGALFQHTGIREGDAIPERLLPRAAALLHYLAVGRQNVVELELGLIKVLVGLQPDTSLPVAKGLLLRTDRDEAGAVLDAAIRHWTVLKKTSRKGLQQSFLQRRGLLRRKEHGWSLHVERKSFDVLVNYLPWSIGIIKLPWMAEPMVTEWPTS